MLQNCIFLVGNNFSCSMLLLKTSIFLFDKFHIDKGSQIGAQKTRQLVYVYALQGSDVYFFFCPGYPLYKPPLPPISNTDTKNAVDAVSSFF